jgi:hypothetical protein
VVVAEDESCGRGTRWRSPSSRERCALSDETLLRIVVTQLLPVTSPCISESDEHLTK